MYSLHYQTRRGSCMTRRFRTIEEAGDAVIALFDRRIAAKLVNDQGEVIGRVFKENNRWNYFYEDFGDG